jgi:hypothetical protein
LYHKELLQYSVATCERKATHFRNGSSLGARLGPVFAAESVVFAT